MHQQQADAALQDAETELTKLAKTRPQDFDGFFRLATSLLRSASHPIGAFLADSLRAFADSFPESGADSLCGHPLEEIDATVSMAEARVHSIARAPFLLAFLLLFAMLTPNRLRVQCVFMAC